MEHTIGQMAEMAEKAIKRYTEHDDVCAKSDVSSLLVGLMHFADNAGVDFESHLRAAEWYYKIDKMSDS